MGHIAKRYLYLSFLAACLSIISVMPATEGYQAGWCERLKPCNMLSQSEAERILGQPARLSREIAESKGAVRQCGCAYTGVSRDSASRQESVLYFVVEQREGNPSAEQAQQVIQATKNDNAHDLSVIEVQGIGDEAFLLISDPNSCFLMARKGGIIIRLQVKHSANVSVEALKAFAKEAIKRL
jgi:hypothetical protein